MPGTGNIQYNPQCKPMGNIQAPITDLQGAADKPITPHYAGKGLMKVHKLPPPPGLQSQGHMLKQKIRPTVQQGYF
ncbi:hypothetical protein NTGZN8_170043 [Candidatus Nitrotoga fabula]|uniref:Uncharacterized protein n=1 Tax=Candidatus Nitrotoga fabula TaxID=2182327 RepID=A0A916BD42_9PROT|nr:hypothetical protein NTGZN8_170043 [Candidatus Nitrotoga fabula]